MLTKLNILKSFIAGSNWFVFSPFFQGFNTLKYSYNMKNMRNVLGKFDPYYSYTIFCPIYFGIMSIISYLIHIYSGINIRLIFLIISLISASNVYLFIKLNKVYDFSDKRWWQQYLYLILYHGFAYNVVIVNILKLLL
jgi:hypothetical protein